MLITSGTRWALMHELRGGPELTLEDAVSRLSPCDLLLIEGYKAFPIPKIEVWRPAIGKPLLHPFDPHILAIATEAARRSCLPSSRPHRPRSASTMRKALQHSSPLMRYRGR